MNCPYCHSTLPEDSTFCANCGAKVEAPQVEPASAPVAEPTPVAVADPAPVAEPTTFCANCGAALAAGSDFCENCGAKTEAPEAPQAAPNSILAKIKAIPPKFLKIGAVALAAVVLVVVLIAIFAGGGKPSYALYLQDDTMFSAKLPSGKPVEITDEAYNSTVYMSADGKRVFFKENDGDLFYRDTAAKKDSVKISGDVSSFKITANGKKVFYLKNSNLYSHDLKDSTKIANDVSEFKITDDGKTVIYIQSDDGYTLYRKVGNKDAIKLASGDALEILNYDEDLSTVIFSMDGDLYTQTGSKDKIKIDSDATIISPYYDDGSFYYVVQDEADEDDSDDDVDADEDYDDEDVVEEPDSRSARYGSVSYDLYYYNGKKSIEIAKEIDGPTYEGSASAATDKAAIVYYINDEDGETTYYVASKDKVAEIKGDEIYGIQINEDGSSVLLMREYDGENGTAILYEAAISGTKMKEAKKITEDVYAGSFGYADGKPYYYTDVKDGEGTLYIAGKKVLDDAATIIGALEDLGGYVAISDLDQGEGTATLWHIKGTKAKKIADDISLVTSDFSPDGQLLYLTDYSKGEGTLMLYNGSKSKKIDTDVSDILKVVVPEGAY